MYSTSAFYASVFVRLIDKLFNILLTYYELMELIVNLLWTLFNILLTYYELMELIVDWVPKISHD